MNITLAMMMAASALYQEVESPLGHTAFFGPTTQPQGAGALAANTTAQKQAMIESIAESYQLLDFECQRNKVSEAERKRLFASLHMMAQGE